MKRFFIVIDDAIIIYNKNNQFGYLCLSLPNAYPVNIYNRSSIVSFYEKHPDCKGTLEKWYHDVKSKQWKKPGDITKDFNTSRTIKNNRVIFGINHNDYRLICEINYQKGWIFIKFIGSHADYDKIDPEITDLFKVAKNN